jgi:Fe2+ or Zn2+ uptake regulation protein
MPGRARGAAGHRRRALDRRPARYENASYMRITRKSAGALAADVDGRCAAFAARCRERGVRVTTQRLAIYRALAADTTHPTADAVHRRLRATMPSLSPATVYRILESLVREGLLRRVSTTEGAGRFDANLAPHQHVVCRLCGRMSDVQVPGLDVGAAAAGRVVRGFVVEDVDVRIVGRCETCRPAAARPRAAGPARSESERGAPARRRGARREPA